MSVFPSSFPTSNRPNSDFAATIMLYTHSLWKRHASPSSYTSYAKPQLLALTAAFNSTDNHDTAGVVARSIERMTIKNPISSAATTYSSTTAPSTTLSISTEARHFRVDNTSPCQNTLNPTQVVDSDGQTLVHKPTTSPASTFPASALIALAKAKTFAETLPQVLTVINEKIYGTFPTPILTVTNGQHLAEVAASFPPTSDIIPFEYVTNLPILHSISSD
jgi:hypothetical protein